MSVSLLGDFSWSAAALTKGAEIAKEPGAVNFIASRLYAISTLALSAIDAAVHAVVFAVKAAIYPITTAIWLLSACSENYAFGPSLGGVAGHALRAIGFTVGMVLLPAVGIFSNQAALNILHNSGMVAKPVAAEVVVEPKEEPVVVEIPAAIVEEAAIAKAWYHKVTDPVVNFGKYVHSHVVSPVVSHVVANRYQYGTGIVALAAIEGASRYFTGVSPTNYAFASCPLSYLPYSGTVANVFATA